MKITIDTKWTDSLRDFDSDTKAALYEAVFDYMADENVTLASDQWRMFAMLQPMLDEERNKRIRLAERSRENGKKGGRNKNKGDDQPKPTGFAKFLGTAEYKERSDKLKALDAWKEKHVPYVYAHFKPLTQREFDCLHPKYSSEQICDTLLQLENRKDLRKKYVSLYRTLLNWLKRYDS